MSNSSFYYSFPCFILPEFPAKCKIVDDNSLLLRDILCCYKAGTGYNDHIYWGGQYDPHYEYEMAPQFKMCHTPYRNKIKKLVDSKAYDKIYIIFRGNKQYVNGSNKHFITGYYEIDQNKVVLDPDYEDYTLYANNAIMVGDNEAIDITKFLYEKGWYQSKFKSDTHNGKYHNKFMTYIENMSEMDNRLQEFIDETNRLERIFKYYEFKEGLYEPCIKCTNKKSCQLVKRVNKYKLHNNLPVKISEIINAYYNENIDINKQLLN